MSVKPKSKTSPLKEVHDMTGACCTGGTCDACNPSLMGNNARKIFLTLLGILLVYVIVWMATLIRNNMVSYDRIGEADRPERSITISADAKVTAAPDIAMTSIGMISRGKTVAEAQQENTKVMNVLIEKMGGLGIAADDIQTTNYNIYPQYTYSETGVQTLSGYEVNQMVQVKIRDVQKANQVLAAAGEVGANNVGGLQFTIDNKDVYLAEAREKALQNVSDKKGALEKSLGLRLGSVISYYESEGGNNGYAGYDKAMSAESAMGGAAPTIQSGSMDVVMNINVTYEVR